MCSGGPYVTVEELTFVARFLLDPGTDTEESVASVDALVDLPDGSSWALTIVTIDEVRRLPTVWGETGEVANGSYFWVADQVIVPGPGIEVMTAAIRELVRSATSRAPVSGPRPDTDGNDGRAAQTRPVGGDQMPNRPGVHPPDGCGADRVRSRRHGPGCRGVPATVGIGPPQRRCRRCPRRDTRPGCP